ncbi:hypothetical protein KIN20_036068 [Parelaphostrongylus tenuis]|uniref:Uncharacterized protein n=1 Tax=Parelaphostrongylus tenuis TaxID=148309 RepID=A0AAD5RC39_PARTN|nr:hypothetical protein KIN20_036068 [Parelaphostrongylus tenuis]
MDEVIECHVLPSAMSPAPASASFTTAAKNFVIAIRVRSFNPDFDSVVIVDDISYRATLCSDALNVFDLGQHFVTTPMLSLLLNKNVNSAKIKPDETDADQDEYVIVSKVWTWIMNSMILALSIRECDHTLIV